MSVGNSAPGQAAGPPRMSAGYEFGLVVLMFLFPTGRPVSPRWRPVGWALAQLHLARLYEARMGMTGKDGGERAAALMALDAALDVFAEHGLRSLSVLATEATERLSARAVS